MPDERPEIDRGQAYLTAARKRYQYDDDFEIDDDARVSESGDRGGWVQIWAWIPDAEAGIEIDEDLN